MANALFSFASLYNEFQGGYNSLQKYREDMDPLCSEFAFCQENVADKRLYFTKDEPQPPISSCGTLGDFQFNTLSAQPILEKENLENVQINQEEQSSFSSASLETSYTTRFKKLKEEKETNIADGLKFSTEEIMRVAGESFIRFSTQRTDDLSKFMHPYGCSLLGLSMDEAKDVKLVQILLSAVENVYRKQFERAIKLLVRCEWMASDTGNPVQRIVYFFSEAIRERIDRETGRITTKRIYGKSLVSGSSFAFVAHHQEIPIMQAIQFAGMQAIVESVSSATKVHLIDLQIRSGIHWSILMQALADRLDFPVKLLKISAVGTANYKEEMERTCKMLASFAESLNLPFSFKVVFLPDMKDIRAGLIDIQDDETVAIYSPTILRSMISRPHCLDNLMRVIGKLKPAIMVINEIEANLNSPSFVKRFTEALFYHSAYFDCFEDCMHRDSKYRRMLEGSYFRDGIVNMFATDGEERINRSVKIDVWREFFARFGMVEIELSESSLYQARLIVNQFACRSSCTLDKNGKCLTVGWKGTPLHSLSTWKFS